MDYDIYYTIHILLYGLYMIHNYIYMNCFALMIYMVHVVWLYLEKAHIHSCIYIRTLQEGSELCTIASDGYPSFSSLATVM